MNGAHVVVMGGMEENPCAVEGAKITAEHPLVENTVMVAVNRQKCE